MHWDKACRGLSEEPVETLSMRNLVYHDICIFDPAFSVAYYCNYINLSVTSLSGMFSYRKIYIPLLV